MFLASQQQISRSELRARVRDFSAICAGFKRAWRRVLKQVEFLSDARLSKP
jgi:hypothetical protein